MSRRDLEAALNTLADEDRAALHAIGQEHARLRRLGRFTNVLPLALIVLYPFVLPWLLRSASRASSRRRRPALRALRASFRQLDARQLSDGRRVEHVPDPDLRGYLSLIEAPIGLGLAIVGPPALVIAALVLWQWLAA